MAIVIWKRFNVVIFPAPMKKIWIAKWNCGECNIAGSNENQPNVKALLNLIVRKWDQPFPISELRRRPELIKKP